MLRGAILLAADRRSYRGREVSGSSLIWSRPTTGPGRARVTTRLCALAACAALSSLVAGADQAGAATVSGTLRQWHRIEVAFDGPLHAESDDGPNPFTDYRLQCTCTGPSGQVYEVPGFFDADGLGGASGSTWKCRLAPDESGTWTVVASFRTGAGIATSLDPSAGVATGFDGDATGFFVAASDKASPDFRASSNGLLVTGAHYLRFAGSGRAWVKGGSNIPENFLGYVGFDGTPSAGHAYAPHVADWRPGDPDWGGGAGRAIIGALNYIAATGGNGLYFLPMNVGGDGNDSYPTIAPQDKLHYDTSKLAQWELVFEHADSLGVFLHFVLSEAELANATYHDGGELGPERKLFYRELVARFGHHLGVEWDIGEENDYGTARRAQFAAYLRAIDPYDHPVANHTKFGQLEETYAPLLGNVDFSMTAIQDGPTNVDDEVIQWRERSDAAGVPWVVSFDEPHSIENDPNDQIRGYPSGRRNFLWPVYLSGGGGFEWYVKVDGGGDGLDQTIEDFRDMEQALRWSGYARSFLETLPLLQMAPMPALGSAPYTLAAPGQAYAMYTPSSATLSVDLTASTADFQVRWFDPVGGLWHDGGIVVGGGWRTIGSAPFAGDAGVSVVRIEGVTTTTIASPTTTSTTTTTTYGATTTTTTTTLPESTTTTTSTSLAAPTTTTSTSTTTTVAPLGCPPAPRMGACLAAQKTVVDLRFESAERARLELRWKRGDAVAAEALASPLEGAEYRLCLYDGSASGWRLAADLTLPVGGGWTDLGTRGFSYRDRAGGWNGVTDVRIRTGAASRSRLRLRAGGSGLALPQPAAPGRYFDGQPAVIVELAAPAGPCWTADFPATAVRENSAAAFRAKRR